MYLLCACTQVHLYCPQLYVDRVKFSGSRGVVCVGKSNYILLQNHSINALVNTGDCLVHSFDPSQC